MSLRLRSCRPSIALVMPLVLALAWAPAPPEEAVRAESPASSEAPSSVDGAAADAHPGGPSDPTSGDALEPDRAATGGHDHAAASGPVADPGQTAKPAPSDHAARPHGDHNAHFGGLVFMDRDLHFEVVARKSGQYEVHFSDEQRTHLPASTVTGATVHVLRPGAEPEIVQLHPDEKDTRWVGSGRAVDDGRTVVRASYHYKGQAYSIDVPFWTLDRSLPRP